LVSISGILLGRETKTEQKILDHLALEIKELVEHLLVL